MAGGAGPAQWAGMTDESALKAQAAVNALKAMAEAKQHKPSAGGRLLGLVLFLSIGIGVVSALGGIATAVWGAFQAVNMASSSASGVSSPFGAAAPSLLPHSELPKLTNAQGWVAVDTTGMVGDLHSFDAAANVAWATSTAQRWAPDAVLYALYVDGVQSSGLMDLSAGETYADYRFFSPTLRKAARDMQAVSTTLPVTELRLMAEEGEVKAMVDTDTGEDEELGPSPLHCPLAPIIAKMQVEGLPMRPGYGGMARALRGAWRWSLSGAGTGSFYSGDTCD